MKIRLFIAQAAIVLAGVAAVAGSASAEVIIVAPNAPPPVRVESVPPARVGYVWDNGHWRWEHGRYVWNQGHWQVERVGYHWVPGHWIARGGAWRWMPGHWA
ncbi:YXWGXW repeat-containing protein [Caballeronia sp. LjRoot34]|uniref:YXWGXW repeat-containing protein n=1 Tax=Caballeronia sp. LjRoot34 TaxID=3342325 RepID=UPI003ECE5823